VDDDHAAIEIIQVDAVAIERFERQSRRRGCLPGGQLCRHGRARRRQEQRDQTEAAKQRRVREEWKQERC